jgi:hypothetical protein
MAWLLVPLVIVVVVYLAGYPRSAAALLAVAVVAAILIYYYNERVKEDARSRIPLSEVMVENVTVTPTFRSSYNLSGSVKNNSDQYELEGISFKVTLRDCPSAAKTSCVSLGDATTYVPVGLQPGESQDFIGSLYFGNEQIKAKGVFAWDYEILAVTGKRP